MIRNLKVLGLALMAVFAFSAVAASAASAVTTDGELTSDGPVTLDVTEIAGSQHALTAFGEKVECPGTKYDGEALNGAGLIQPPATTATITPEYPTTCTATGPHKATVTTNGCHYVFHIGETTGLHEDEYNLSTDIFCPAGKVIEVHVYLATGNENVVVCTLKVKPQNGLAGATITSDTTNDDLTIDGTFNGIHVEKEGLCGAGTTTVGQFHAASTVKGTNAAHEPTGITITH